MKVLVLDLETTVQFIDDINEETDKLTKVIDNSPFNPKNKIVSAHWRKLETVEYGPPYLHPADHSIYYHNDVENSITSDVISDNKFTYDTRDSFQASLDWAEVLVAHNAKYDVMYLLEADFKLPDTVYCTMIGEYILARGVEMSFSLENIAERRNTAQKKLDTTKAYFKAGIGFEAMPLPIVIEYADADVLSTAMILIQQWTEYAEEHNETLNNIVVLMNEMLWFLVEIERNGIQIDLAKLAEIEQDYITERAQLEKDLNVIAKSVMGDEPFKLTSGPDLSKIVYSREVTDRARHKDIFNLGTDYMGKKKYPPYMTVGQFNSAVRLTTKVYHKKEAKHCTLCHGRGFIRKTKKDGSPFKNDTTCSRCAGRGYTLTDTPTIGGLRLLPERPSDASVHGFAVSKTEMSRLIAQAQQAGKLDAVDFLQKKRRLNAVNTYLNSFVEGIKRWTRSDGLLHAWFNQTVAKTGRLSSSHPNFQNQPKERKFPIRQCVISRFDGGVITECDFSGLEFVVAGELSRDPQIIDDILKGKDIHKQTASIVHRKPKEEITKDERNEVKPYTFAPLYGGQGANEPEHIRQYFKEFFNIYKRHGEWQIEQMDSVITNGFVRTPSGREYAFPGTKRLKNNRTTNSTAIVNYPVQGFATGDIVPLACIRALRKFRELELKSKLIITVHDSIGADTHPDEKQQVAEALKWATEGAVDEIKERWNYMMILPLKSEVSQGINWMEMETV